MRTSKLKLNDEKMEVVLYGTRQQLEKLGEDNTFEIKIGSEVIKPTPLAINLGFHMEAQLKSQTHNKSMWYSILYSEKYSQGLELVNTRSNKNNNSGFGNK